MQRIETQNHVLDEAIRQSNLRLVDAGIYPRSGVEEMVANRGVPVDIAPFVLQHDTYSATLRESMPGAETFVFAYCVPTGITLRFTPEARHYIQGWLLGCQILSPDGSLRDEGTAKLQVLDAVGQRVGVFWEGLISDFNLSQQKAERGEPLRYNREVTARPGDTVKLSVTTPSEADPLPVSGIRLYLLCDRLVQRY